MPRLLRIPGLNGVRFGSHLLLAGVLAGCSVSAGSASPEASPTVDAMPGATASDPGAAGSGQPSSDLATPSPAESASPSPTREPTPDPTAEPTLEPTPSAEPTPTAVSSPRPSTSPGPAPLPTPWPMAVMSGTGTADGYPFTFQVWIDHEDVAHGSFSGKVRGESGPVLLEGPVSCAWIRGTTGVFGGRSTMTDTDFTIMVSDGPDGMIIGTDRPGCDTTGFGDPASLPISDGQIHVIPEP
jgi:hypothetical protein